MDRIALQFARRGSRRWAGVLILAATVASLGAAGCGEGEPSGGKGEPSARESSVIDEAAGTYRGVGIEDRRSDVERKFGSSPPLKQEAAIPLDGTIDDVHLSPAYSCETTDGDRRGRWTTLRYEGVAFDVDGDEVCGFIVIDQGASTASGVATGDDLGEAEKAYPSMACDTVSNDSGESSYPYCTGELEALRFIWFGGDPIDTIQLNAQSLDPVYVPPGGVGVAP